MIKRLQLIVLFFFLLFATASWAQTGSIKGVITDKKTKETIPGATVLVLGTYSGTQTDINGNYKLINIKPGEYSIKITYLGYKEVIYNGAKISSSKELILNLSLSEATTDLGAVEILGQKTIIDLEAGRSTSKVTSEDIKDMNVKDVQSIVAMQAGVSQNPDGLQIRGGRVYETQFLVDGVNAQDPLAGTGFGVEVASNAIKDVEVITGGVGAEYGEGTSGLVLTRIREGGDQIQFSGAYTRDNLGFNEASQWNSDAINLSVGGKLPFSKKKIGFFVSGNMELTDEFFKITADQLKSSLLKNGGEFWAPRQDNRWSNTIKLTYNLKKGQKLTASNQYSLNINQNTRSLQIIGNNAIVTPGFQYPFSLDLDNGNTYTQKSNLTILQYQNLLSNRVSIDVSLARLFVNLRADANGRLFRGQTVDQVFDPASIVSGDITLFNPGDSVVFVNQGPGLFNNNGIATLWHDHYAIENTLKFKINYQLNKANFFTAGFEHKEQEYQWIDVSRPWIGAPLQINDSASTPSTSIGQSNDIWKVNPATGGIFAQNDLRYKGIIVNIGLRLNYWAPGKFADDAVEDPNAPVLDATRNSYRNNTTPLLGRNFKFRLLPKLRISFPISENNVLFFNYGHLTRLPHPRFVYAGLDPVYQNRSFLSNLGNPDLNPEVTVSYEVGLKTQITSNFAISAAAFYNDKYDYIVSRTLIIKDQTGRFTEKNFFINQDYARVRGLEISFNRRVKRWLNASLTGAYQIATGKSNSALESQLQIKQTGNISPTKEQFLAGDRPLDIKFQVILKPDTSFKIFNIPFKNYRVFLTSTYKSGLRYTPALFKGINEVGRPIYEIDEENPFSKLGAAWYFTDLKITKDFYISRLSTIGLSLEIKNAFNNKNSAIINSVTGRAYERGDNLESNFRDPNYPDPQDNGIPPFNPARFLNPRQLLVGLSWQF